MSLPRIAALAACAWPLLAQRVGGPTDDFGKVSMDELFSVQNELYWGAGHQQYWDDTPAGRMGFTQAAATYRAGDVLLRDEWQFVPGLWAVSGGARLDYSSSHRLEYQPSFRLLYTPSARQSAWFAVSRAIRAPSRIDRDIVAYEGLSQTDQYLAEVTMVGDAAFRSEVERSLEAGYRVQSGQRWSVDASVFWSYYGRLRLLATPLMEPVLVPGPPPLFQTQSEIDNGGAGRTYGGEAWGSFRVGDPAIPLRRTLVIRWTQRL